jgi:hypothetical protein
MHGLDAREAARYPHEQTARDVEQLERALQHLRGGQRREAARALAQVGLNWLCSDLGHEAFRIERGRRGRNARRASWGGWGDPDVGPDLWEELSALRGEAGARMPGAWLEERVEGHLRESRRELRRRFEAMAAGASGRIPSLPPVRKEDLPS